MATSLELREWFESDYDPSPWPREPMKPEDLVLTINAISEQFTKNLNEAMKPIVKTMNKLMIEITRPIGESGIRGQQLQQMIADEHLRQQRGGRYWS